VKRRRRVTAGHYGKRRADTGLLEAELLKVARSGEIVERPKCMTYRKAVAAIGLGKLCKCGARLGRDSKATRCTACAAIYMKHYRDRKARKGGEDAKG